MKDNANKKTADKKKRKKIGRLGLFLALMIVAGIIGIIVSAIDFFGRNPVRRNVSMSIEFTYDGAAQNRLPNGETFTIDGILRDDVIDAAINSLGLQNYYTVDSIRNSMMIKGSFPSDVIERLSKYNSVYDYNVYRDVEEENYYPTVYTVTLFDDFSSKTTNLEMSDILSAIVEKYKEYFIRTYVYSYDSSQKEAILSIDDVDYRHQVNLLAGRIETLKNYAAFMTGKAPNFFYNSLNFKDYTIKCNDLQKNGLSGLEAYIMMKAYSKYPERLRNMYQYRIKLLKNEQTRSEERLDEINKLIDEYKLDDILYVGMSGDDIVKVESNSRKTYEALTSRKIEINQKLTNINEDILRNNEYLVDLIKSTDYPDAEIQINAVNEKLTVIESDFSEMIKAYNDSIVNESNIKLGSVYITSPKLISGSFIARFIKLTAPIAMVFLLFFCAIVIFQERKRIA